MIQLLNILSDVIRIATFQWQDEKPHRRPERPADCARWSPSADRYPVRRLRS
jgi:hypothetical protein